MKPAIEHSIKKVTLWVEDHDFRAYDPGDGNLSYLRVFTFGNLFLERLLQQSVYRAPVNLRPLYGIKPHRSTKGTGYFAWGYLKMFKLTGNPRYRERAVDCLDWLINHKAPSYSDYCWGNHFPFSTRSGKIPALEPTIVWSSLIGFAFLEAYETLGSSRYLDVASSICDWILALPKEQTERGCCLSYVAYEQSSIHNSNLLGAALLAQVGRILNRPASLQVAKEAVAYSCARQNPDGSWYYGEAPKYHWIDNFHTGYNLDCLKRYTEATGDLTYSANISCGFEYFKRNFFEPDGCPKYYHNRRFPIDIQCAAQAIDTLTFFSDEDPDALELAQRVARWTIDNMQSPDGHFYYRDLGWALNKTPMLHWGQGTMFKALAHLLCKLSAIASQVDRKSGSRTPDVASPATAASIVNESSLPSYALVTPARNEEKFIEQTIRSVLAQTVRPVKWVIVSDGSTDQTDAIVERYTRDHPWLELIRMPEHRDRQFAAKVHAFAAGYARLNGTRFDIIGNLDADITFEPDYLEFLLTKFAENPQLGVAGTPFVEDSERREKHTYAHQFAQLEHVSGACQMFRKECFEEVGGYVPVKGGAVDWIAVTTARMKGWETRTFLEKTCLHHRKLGTGTDNKLMVRFRYGQKAYFVGGHPLWEALRGVFQMRKKPLLVGGIYFLCGYYWTALSRMKRPVSRELIAFHRAEQMARLKIAFNFGSRKPANGARASASTAV